MRSPTRWFLLLLLLFLAPALFAQDQGVKTDGKRAGHDQATASAQEVEALRSEVADQKKAIEELQGLVQRLSAAGQQAGVAHLTNANATASDLAAVDVAAETPSDKPGEKKDDKKKDTATNVTAGFNGEHFYIKSADGKFQIQPYGYLDSDYRAFSGDGAPSDTFVIRRARFGFQGNYGKHYEFAVLVDAASTTGSILRDIYVNIKPSAAFQFQVGQFKVPFSQEVATSATNLDFVERSIASILYPDAASAFRSPGATVHGDLWGGAFQYWAGAFNGKGYATANTTNQPEIIGRMRIYPAKGIKGSKLQGFAFGGSVAYGRTRALSNETSFSGTLPNGVFTFFPSFRINGTTWRYNGEFAWTQGPWSLKGEYDQLLQSRRGVGSDQVVALDFTNLPGVSGKGAYGSVTYVLTGEKKPENGTPKVKHPLFGPEIPGDKGAGGHGFGAFEIGFRYGWLQAKASGINQLTAFTPSFVPTFQDHTDEFTFGLNWYLNYWVKYMVNFNVDRLKDPSVTGALPQNYFVLLQRVQFRF